MPVRGYNPNYKPESPYALTQIAGNYMAYYIHRSIDPQQDDIITKMDNPIYVSRPDLLANDVYGDPDLWWVFGVRNGFEDPIYDLTLGITIAIPQLHYVRSVL